MRRRGSNRTFLLADFDRGRVEAVLAHACASDRCYTELVLFAFVQVRHGGAFAGYREIVDFLPVASGFSLLDLITWCTDMSRTNKSKPVAY